MWVRLKEGFRNLNISNSSGFAIRGNQIVKVPDYMEAKDFPSSQFDLFDTFEDAQKGKVLAGKPIPVSTPAEKPVKPKQYTEQELYELYNDVGWFKFREWTKANFKVTGRNAESLIKDILGVQAGTKKPEL